MTARKLAVGVYVDGVFHEPGSTPDKDVAKLITNPKAWGNEPDEDGDTDAEAKADAERGYPEGDPVEGWTHDQLDAYAKAKDVALTGATTKADKVAAITAAAQA